MDLVNFLKQNYYETKLDERTVDWWPVKHEWIVFVIFFSYLYFVLRCGPKYMENKRPYSLKIFIKCYNIFQIIYNTWIVYASVKYGLFSDIGIGCVFVDKATNGSPMELAKVFYWTLILKIIDLVETVVFVLRKKNRQISFLHVYHHISTIYLTVISVKFFPGGMATVPIFVNSCVHVIMYTYYFLSSQGPNVQIVVKHFKPYITIIQMLQFFFLLGHTFQAFMSYCTVPKWGATVMALNLLANVVLFYNFYKKNYNEPTKPKNS